MSNYPFKLSDTFLEKYKGKQPRWGYGTFSYVTYKRCVEINTLVLCADMQWRPAGSLKPNDKIIGFDDLPRKNGRRYLKPGMVVFNKIEEAECVGIELEDGQTIYATPDHRWLINRKSAQKLEWRESKDLLKLKKGDATYLIRPFGTPWEVDQTRDGGYIAGVYDGEGAVDRTHGIQFAQNNNSVLNNVEAILNKNNIKYHKSLKVNNKLGKQECYNLAMYGIKNTLRFLGIYQPIRLIHNFNFHLKTTPKNMRCGPEDNVKVIRIFNAGKRKISVLSTDIETHFTAGFASHNTYSREKPDGTTEEFWETLERVVNGVFNTQKEHCAHLNLVWDNKRAQKTAQIMFDKMWTFKFLPPGRGLWAMGADAVKIKGSAILNNCAAVSTAEIDHDFTAPFCWTLDMLCLGVGVGFDVLGANKTVIQKPNKGATEGYRIPDTREGWVEALRLVLKAFEDGSIIPEFDFSLIRPAGAKIKTFGGVSSGPQPLINLLNSVELLLTERIGQKITSVDIVDIMNFIGRCAVAGNVRRSAELALGSPDDEAFITCKNPKLYQKEIYDRRWASNNSVTALEGMDYTKFAEMTALNGEPGYVWLDNTRMYGRMKDEPDFKDANIIGFNPCKPLWSTILTHKYGYITFAQALELSDSDLDIILPDGKIARASKPFKTGVAQKVYKVRYTQLCDSPIGYQCIWGTANHKHQMLDGSWKEIKDLKPGDTFALFPSNDCCEKTVVDVTEVEGLHDVYDITVYNDIHAFIDNGIISHNCSEQPLENFELCNLVEVFPAHHDTIEEFYDTLKYAYLYSKTVTLIPTHDARSNAVMLRNRRIGTSLSGVEQAKRKFGTTRFYRDMCDKGYEIIRNWDKIYSNWLCIPRSIKVTTVKPSGTVSILAGATPGVHASHGEYYFRTIRLASNSPITKALIKAGYKVEYGATEWKPGLVINKECALVENGEFRFEVGDELEEKHWHSFINKFPMEYDENGNLNIINFIGTVVAYFPIHEDNFFKSKFEQTIWEQMENAAKMQHYWSDNGVSVTINFHAEEAKEIKTVLEHYESRLKAVSFLPHDHGYEQAPYISCTKEEHDNYAKQLSDIDVGSINESDRNIDNYCTTDTCLIKQENK